MTTSILGHGSGPVTRYRPEEFRRHGRQDRAAPCTPPNPGPPILFASGLHLSPLSAATTLLVPVSPKEPVTVHLKSTVNRYDCDGTGDSRAFMIRSFARDHVFHNTTALRARLGVGYPQARAIHQAGIKASMPQIELSAGPIEYSDTGGTGPVLVFLHGVIMDGSVWRNVVASLEPDYRCVVPTLPLGAHRQPMHESADLSLRGLALLVGEFLERLELHDTTLVLNDWGGGQVLLSENRAQRIGRLVLTSCEAFDNYPPGLPGRFIWLAGQIPGGIKFAMDLFRLRALRRAPGGWGWMSKRPVPNEVMDNWFRPAQTQAEIRRDLAKYARTLPPKATLLDWAEKMRSFERPVLVAWAVEDKIMPREHGRRLAELFPNARLVEIEDSYTLIPEDQPDLLARLIRDFVPTQTVGQRSGPASQ
jgi:pimeloyl-ACP methyl ester carboxylesterase